MMLNLKTDCGEQDNTMKRKQDLIDQIITHEWMMFSAVNAHADSGSENKQHPTCQDFPDEFRLHRESKLLPWSVATLQSYLNDLIRAQKAGTNLMTYKYARMDNLIPCENINPNIDSIATQLVLWQKAFMEAYPGIMSKGRPLSGGRPGVDWPSFENYLRCELETYSDQTLEHLSHDIHAMVNQGKNMSEEVYTYLIRNKGYTSLEQAEDKNR